MKKYKHLVFAGTFDNLHRGHRELLNKAFDLAQKVSIGITSDEMVREKLLGQSIEKYDVRLENVRDLLRKKSLLSRAAFFKLDDIYGSSTRQNNFDSILVTKFTRPNAIKINNRRKLHGLKPLEIIVALMVKGTDGKIISSERIRQGEIDREGNNYTLELFGGKRKRLLLPHYLRSRLRKPLGVLIHGSEDELEKTAEKVVRYVRKKNPLMVLSVGDVVTMSLEKVGYKADVNILDLRSRRVDMHQAWLAKYGHLQKYSNPPGTIQKNAAETIDTAVKKFIKNRERTNVVIAGEEDLLTLPAILLAPLNSVVLYGQWNMGVVMVEVTEEKKKQVQKVIGKFI